MRTLSVLGALGQRRLGEMALCNGNAFIDVGAMYWVEPERWECDHERGIMYHGRKAKRAEDLARIDAMPRDTIGQRARRLVAMLNVSRPIMDGFREAVELDVTRQFLANRGGAMGTRTPGKTKMLASSYTGMHNEGSFWHHFDGEALRSDPYYGPWLPHPEPEVFYQ